MVYPHSYRTEHSETHTTNGEYGDYYRSHHSKKIPIQPPLLKTLQWIDSNNIEMINNLKEVVKIKSIGGDQKYATEVIDIIKYMEDWLVQLGAKTEVFDIGFHKVQGKKVPLPPVLLATLRGASKKIVCVYANVDVKKPCASNWNSDPWNVVERDKALYGNGVALGKGPLIAWLSVISSLKENKIPLPITVKFIIESMHHNRSMGLKDFLMTQKQDFLSGIDYVAVCGSEWLGDKYPCICYGCVGILHFTITITQTGMCDARTDMYRLCEKLVDKDKILIPEFYKLVSQVTPDEEKLYEAINFNMDEFKKHLPPEMQEWSKSKLLMHFWRTPSVLVEDIQECTCAKMDRLKIKRPFVIKIVPKQNSVKCIQLVEEYVKFLTKELNIQNTVEVEAMDDTTRPWLEDCSSTNYEAARRATIQIYKEDPSMIREDGDMVCINILEMIERNILLLPLAAKGSNAGGPNEHIALRNFFEGTKLIAAYLFQIAALSK